MAYDNALSQVWLKEALTLLITHLRGLESVYMDRFRERCGPKFALERAKSSWASVLHI
jgi:hypothetical protein